MDTEQLLALLDEWYQNDGTSEEQMQILTELMLVENEIVEYYNSKAND